MWPKYSKKTSSFFSYLSSSFSTFYILLVLAPLFIISIWICKLGPQASISIWSWRFGNVPSNTQYSSQLVFSTKTSPFQLHAAVEAPAHSPSPSPSPNETFLHVPPLVKIHLVVYMLINTTPFHFPYYVLMIIIIIIIHYKSH